MEKDEIKVFVVIDTDTLRLSEMLQILQDYGKPYDAMRPQDIVAIQDQEKHIDAVFVSSNIPNLKENVNNIMKVVRGMDCSIYVVGDINPDALADLFYLGIRDVLAHPISPSDVGLHQRQSMPYSLRGEGKRIDVDFGGQPITRERFVVVCSPKGGTGKTTIAAQAGIVLAKIAGNTVLLDGDYAGNAHRTCGLDAINSIAEFKEERTQLLDRDTIEQKLVLHDSGLKILASPVNVLTPIPADMLKNAILAYRKYYSMMVIDLPDGYNPSLDMAKDYATDILVVMENDPRQLERNNEFLNRLISRNIDPERMRIIVSKAKSGNVSEIRYLLSKMNLDIPVHILPYTNEFEGDILPVLLEPRKSKYSRAFRDIMREMGLRGKTHDHPDNEKKEGQQIVRLLKALLPPRKVAR